MDREDSDQTKLTLNFIDIIVHPLYKRMNKSLGGLEDALKNLEFNRLKWLEPTPTPRKEVEKGMAPKEGSKPKTASVVRMSLEALPSRSLLPKLPKRNM